MPWNLIVDTKLAFGTVPDAIAKKVNEVRNDNGRNGDGNSTIDRNSCQHWRQRSNWFFGSWAREVQEFNFVADGARAGAANHACGSRFTTDRP